MQGIQYDSQYCIKEKKETTQAASGIKPKEHFKKKKKPSERKKKKERACGDACEKRIIVVGVNHHD